MVLKFASTKLVLITLVNIIFDQDFRNLGIKLKVLLSTLKWYTKTLDF